MFITKRVRYKEKCDKKYWYVHEVTSYWFLWAIPIYVKETIKEVYKRSSF